MAQTRQSRRRHRAGLFWQAISTVGVGSSELSIPALHRTTSVFRKGTLKTLSITAPAGWSVSWQLIESESASTSPVVVASGSTRTVSYNGAALTDADGRVLKYDVLLTASIGLVTLTRRYRHGILMGPVVFTRAQANLVINMDTYSGNGFFDFENEDNTGLKIWIEGTKQFSSNGESVDSIKSFIFYRLRSLDPENPAHIMVAPGTQVFISSRNTGSAVSLKIAEECQNVYIDGAGSDSQKYGWKLGYGDNLTLEQLPCLFLQTSSSSTDAASAMKNITIVGVDIDGDDRAAAGFWIRGDNSDDNNYTAWKDAAYAYLSGINASNIRINNIRGEGSYKDQNNAGSGASAYSGVSFSYFWNFEGDHIGNDAWQMAIMYKSEAHDLYFTRCAYRNNAGHNNFLQLVDNVDCHVYRFSFSGDDGAQVVNNLSATKSDNTAVFSGIFSNRRSSLTANIFNRFDDHDTESEIDFRYSRLTIDTPNCSFAIFNHNRATNGVTMNKLVETNCAIVNGVSTLSDQSGSPDTTNWVQTNNYVTTNSLLAGFVDYANRDFSPASLASALFGTIETSNPVVHPCYNEDVDGYAYIADIRGAKSGALLQL